MRTQSDEHARGTPAAEVDVPADAAAPPGSVEPGEATMPGVPPLYAAPDRPRGLNAYFAPGGEDEATDDRRADERRNLRLLLLMVALLVGIPTVLTIIAFVGQIVAKQGGG